MKRIKSEYKFLIILFIGVILLAYPSVSNYINSYTASRVINSYSEVIGNINKENLEEEIKKAKEYNEKYVYSLGEILSDEREKEYNELLNPTNNGVMGYIEIPKIGVKLPIYHGTDETVLSVGVGHVDWSSLPVGGYGTHSVLSGHRGLPSAKLFTDLDMMDTGDYFKIEVCGETLTYEIDQISVIIPEDLEILKTIKGDDICTLVTCTPYGINTHRLLLTGHRTENIKNYNVVSDATKIDSKLVAFFIAFPVLVILFIIVMLKKEKK